MNETPMRIAMFTNTYAPHVGGVARSVESFTRKYRERGHRVLVVAPEFEGIPPSETDVVRVPAIQEFNGSDFSVALFTPEELTLRLEEFQPEIVHSHHPFLLGNEAVRVAAADDLPLVTTHHTLYEQYTHYVPSDSSLLRRFVIQLATCYANLCDQVFAPSESVAALIEERGVETPIAVVPTGVDYEFFSAGDGDALRAELGIPADCFLIGHVGRLAPEKNLDFLARAVLAFLADRPDARFLLAGDGPSRPGIAKAFEAAGCGDRLIQMGEVRHNRLRHAYAAMDVFAFASRSETQGMVLTESMAAGTPVVALEASGVREVLSDRRNGYLVSTGDIGEFVAGLAWVAGLDDAHYEELRKCARETGENFSMDQCADRALSMYARLLERPRHRGGRRGVRAAPWQRIVNQVATEWDIISGNARALGIAAVNELTGEAEDAGLDGRP